MMKSIKIPGWSLCSTLFFLGTSLSLGAEAQAGAAELPAFFTRFESFTYSEPQSVKDTVTDWGTTFDRGERQWSWARLELGFRVRQFEFSLIQRADYDLRFNSRAAELWGRIDRKKPLEAGQSTDIQISTEALHATGLRLGYRHDSDIFSVGFGLTIWRANYLVDGRLEGDVHVVASKDYDFAAKVDYVYSEDLLFDRPDVDDPAGEGYSLDVQGQWRVNDQWSLAIRAEDLLARIRWKEAPYTDAVASSRRKTYDKNGYVNLKPVLSGYEYYRDHTQKLSARVHLGSEYRFDSHISGLLDVRHQFDQTLYAAGVGYRWSDQQRVEARYWLDNGAVELAWLRHGFGLSLALDDWQLHRTRTLWLSLSYGY